MADNRTMTQLLEAPTEGYEDAIVVPEFTANNFEIKHGLLNLFKTSNVWNVKKTKCSHPILSTRSSSMMISDVPNSLNSAASGHFLDKMPRECLKIIESKSKVRQSQSKAVIAKLSMSSSTPAVSSDVSELKDMVRALILDKKNQTPAPAPIKAVEQSCVTCGGGHSYQNCPATDGNVYCDNIQEYVSQATAVNYSQGNASYRLVANQIRPFGQVYPTQINQPPTFQAPPYQAPAPVPPAPVRVHFKQSPLLTPKGDVKASLPEAVFPIMALQILFLAKRLKNETEG
ncbi:hypothetical protein Tco_0017453 [Tanacetum coccineum]